MNAINYQEVINSCTPFTDPDFAPNLQSIFDPADHTDNANLDLYASIEWKRATEIYPDINHDDPLVPSGFVIFPEQIDADDIKQGRIGDCYFISCLAALAAKPDRIKKLIKTSVPNLSGCYVINMCINGTW